MKTVMIQRLPYYASPEIQIRCADNKGGCKCQACVCASAEPMQQEINSKNTMATDRHLQFVIGRDAIPFLEGGWVKLEKKKELYSFLWICMPITGFVERR